VGKPEDLILLDGNPLIDIHNIRQVSYVMTGGKIFSSTDLWRSIGFKP
jgi:imidazolonepropionase-like amidohydrolase